MKQQLDRIIGPPPVPRFTTRVDPKTGATADTPEPAPPDTGGKPECPPVSMQEEPLPAWQGALPNLPAWEYMRHRGQFRDDLEMIQWMDTLGEQGWECFAVVPVGTAIQVYFRRQCGFVNEKPHDEP